jgi:hypothetical protein
MPSQEGLVGAPLPCSFLKLKLHKINTKFKPYLSRALHPLIDLHVSPLLPPSKTSVARSPSSMLQTRSSRRTHHLCHQKYFTLQFRPSPSEIVVMTRRTSPLTIQCIIPICMWNTPNLTNPTLCLLTFLNLGQCHVFVLLQSPSGRLGHNRLQGHTSPEPSPCR